jgi:hypothetical protein
VLLGKGNAHQPQLAQPAHDLVRERLRAVELLGHRRDLLAGELAHRPLDQAVIVGQVEVHARGILTEEVASARGAARRAIL